MNTTIGIYLLMAITINNNHVEIDRFKSMDLCMEELNTWVKTNDNMYCWKQPVITPLDLSEYK